MRFRPDGCVIHRTTRVEDEILRSVQHVDVIGAICAVPIDDANRRLLRADFYRCAIDFMLIDASTSASDCDCRCDVDVVFAVAMSMITTTMTTIMSVGGLVPRSTTTRGRTTRGRPQANGRMENFAPVGRREQR